MSDHCPKTTAQLNCSIPNVQTMHGDTSSCDCSSLVGPGSDPARISYAFHACLATFPSIFRRADGHVMALASSFRQELVRRKVTDDTSPYAVTAEVWLINGDTGEPLCEPVAIPQASIFGGVYAYLDGSDDGLVVTTTVKTDDRRVQTQIVKVTARGRDEGGLDLNAPEVLADITAGLASADADMPDSIVSLSPDSSGAIWFVTAQGNVGVSGPFGTPNPPLFVWSIAGAETVNNSFSTTRHPWLGDVAALTTNKALYIFVKDPRNGAPKQLHRLPYATGAGPNPKPGQLEYPPSIYLPENEQQLYGTGSTPSFFGPEHGAEWVTITDNATDALNLLVFDVATGDLVTSTSLFHDSDPRAPHARATENSCIAFGNTVFVPSTSGYPYPVKPFFEHRDTKFVGGLTRVDIQTDGNGVFTANPVWTQYHRSAAVPRWSLQDGNIYTITRQSGGKIQTDTARLRDTFSYTVIEPVRGDILLQIPLEMTASAPKDHLSPEILHGFGNPLQMTCCMTTDTSGAPVMWQGTMGGYYRIKGPSA